MKLLFKTLVLLPYIGLLVSCAHAPSGRSQVGRAPLKPQSFAPEIVSAGKMNAPPVRTVKYNVPSAPLSTPLCGSALREQAQTGQKIYGQSLTSGNSCSLNACFQPLTGVYISQSGMPVVCR